MPGARPKWGQHFLKDQSLCYKIAASLSLQAEDLVVEIGPGRGAVTRLLAPRARLLVAIEIDHGLAAKLNEEFSRLPQVEIIAADILEVDLSSLLKRHDAHLCYVFGNLPYFITSPILRHLFNQRASIRHMSLLMQREVAERVTAKPGSRAYGYLSVHAQFHSDSHIALAVPPGAFSPPPKVQSALVDFRMIPSYPLWNEDERTAFLHFVHLCFGQKRKTLANNLAAKYSPIVVQTALNANGIEETARAEQLGLADLAAIFRAVREE